MAVWASNEEGKLTHSLCDMLHSTWVDGGGGGGGQRTGEIGGDTGGDRERGR